MANAVAAVEVADGPGGSEGDGVFETIETSDEPREVVARTDQELNAEDCNERQPYESSECSYRAATRDSRDLS